MIQFRNSLLAFVFCLILAAPAYAAEVTVNKIAAVVNGEIITLHELRTQTAAELARRGLSQSDPRASQIMRGILDAMINDILMRHEAERFKVTISDNDVDAELNKLIQRSRLSPQAFEAQLQRQGATLAMLKENIKNGMLRQRMMNFMVARKVVVTKDEVAQYYEGHKEEFVGQKTADFSIIIFSPSVKVEEVYAKIKGGALSFEEAARKYSIDKSAQAGGAMDKIPWAALPEQMRQLLSSLSPGEVSSPVRLDVNAALVRLNSLSTGATLTLEEATPQITEKLREPRLQERFNEYAQQLRSKAVVDIRM